jgi:Mrp family chromosome partitioning ATPase
MDRATRFFITAIADIEVESFLTASLQRLGHHVVYRALSCGDLLRNLKEAGDISVTVIISKDFAAIEELLQVVDSQRISFIPLLEIPHSDFDVSELIRPIADSNNSSSGTLKLDNHIIGVASLGTRVGASTLALNIAQEIANSGKETLLIDGNIASRFLRSHFDIFGLNRELINLDTNFNLFELETMSAFEKFLPEVSRSDYLVIDIGDIHRFEERLAGRRKSDAAFNLMAHHGSELLVVTDEERIAQSEVQELFGRFKKTSLRPKISYILNQSTAINRRAKERQSALISTNFSAHCQIFNRDIRGVSKMVSQKSTLAKACPQSRLRHEILQFCKGRNWVTS